MREIKLTVRGDTVQASRHRAGIRGEANATALVVTFDESWDNYAKKITFWDALEQNPVERTLTVDLLVDAANDVRTYRTTIPGEPLALAGECLLVIDGYVDGVRARSMPLRLTAEDAPMAKNAGEPSDPTPTQAEQLQVQIDALIVDIQTVAQGVVEVREIADHFDAVVEGATGTINNALSDANAAASRAKQSEENAAASKLAASEHRTASEEAEQGAKSAEQGALAAEHGALAAAEQASQHASAAGTSSAQAKDAETRAKDAETRAKGYADDAYKSKVQAEAAAKRAAEYDPKEPYINKETNTWMEWDGAKYVDTGKLASVDNDAFERVSQKVSALDEIVDPDTVTLRGEDKNPDLRITTETFVSPEYSVWGAWGETGGDESARLRFAGEEILLSMPDGVTSITTGPEGADAADLPYSGARLSLRADQVLLALADKAEVKPAGEYESGRVIPGAKVKLTTEGLFLNDKQIVTSPMMQEELAKKMGYSGGTLTGPLYYKSTGNQFLRTDNIVSWAITNMDTWTPFFSSFNIGRVEKKSYTGTGTYGSENRKSITFSFQPKVVIIKRRMGSIPKNADGTEKTKSVNDATMIAFYGDGAVVSSILLGDTSYAYCTTLSWSGKTLSWWGGSETRHLNISGNTYSVLAIG